MSENQMYVQLCVNDRELWALWALTELTPSALGVAGGWDPHSLSAPPADMQIQNDGEVN